MDKAWSGKHTFRLYRALTSDEASILVQTRTEHCGLNACLLRKRLAEKLMCECGCGDETVLHVLLHCERYTEARVGLRVAAGDRWGDAYTYSEVLADIKTLERASLWMAHAKVGSRKFRW
jgi:hypothetical protein